jgi:hypothetical protein
VTPTTKRIKDYSGRTVRLSAERWQHVVEHSEMVGQERKLRQTLREPQKVLTSRLDSSVHLYYRLYERSPVGRKYLTAAVKMLDEDAFVITAFFTDEIKGGSIVWPK